MLISGPRRQEHKRVQDVPVKRYFVMNMRWSMGHIGWNEPLIPRMSYGRGFSHIVFLFEPDCLVEGSIRMATSTLTKAIVLIP